MNKHSYDRQCSCPDCTNTERHMTALAQSGYRAGIDLDPPAKPRREPIILPVLVERDRY